MKLFKQIQEDGVFGVAARLESSIRSHREYQTLRRELRKKGITDYQIDMIRTSEPRKLYNIDGTWQNKYCLGDQFRPEKDYDHEIEAVKNLHKRGYIWTDRRQDYWFLTKTGINTRNDLEYHNPTEETLPVVKPQNVARDHMVDEQTNINLGRDGLMTTCSKLWWVWNNKDAVEDKRRKEFLEEFQRGQDQIDECLQMIATSEQRVARKLIEQGPPPAPKSIWTEEQQRAQNDLYWLGGGVAFWLNPKGLLANATPAPEWWSPPVDYKSLTARHLEERKEDDVVALSLLAPPSKEEKKANYPEWLGKHDRTGVVYGLNTQAEVDAFIGARRFEGVGYTVSKYYGVHSGPSYYELYDIYVKQGMLVPALPEDIQAKHDDKAREAMLDELLDELTKLGDADKDSYDVWDKSVTRDKRGNTKIRTGIRKNTVNPAANLFIVEFDNVVRGFDSKLEADTWLGEQRTFRQQEAMKQEEQKLTKANSLRGDKIASKIDIYAPRMPRPSKMMK